MKRIEWIERAQKKGNIEDLARSAYQLGALANTVHLKAIGDKYYETGRSVSRPGEESRRGRTAEQRNAAIRALTRAGVKVGVAIATVAAEDGVTVQAVEKGYYPRKRPTPVSRR